MGGGGSVVNHAGQNASLRLRLDSFLPETRCAGAPRSGVLRTRGRPPRACAPYAGSVALVSLTIPSDIQVDPSPPEGRQAPGQTGASTHGTLTATPHGRGSGTSGLTCTLSTARQTAARHTRSQVLLRAHNNIANIMLTTSSVLITSKKTCSQPKHSPVTLRATSKTRRAAYRSHLLPQPIQRITGIAIRLYGDRHATDPTGRLARQASRPDQMPAVAPAALLAIAEAAASL